MKSKGYEVQLEVWAWERRAYKEVQHRPSQERIRFTTAGAQALIDVVLHRALKRQLNASFGRYSHANGFNPISGQTCARIQKVTLYQGK